MKITQRFFVGMALLAVCTAAYAADKSKAKTIKKDMPLGDLVVEEMERLQHSNANLDKMFDWAASQVGSSAGIAAQIIAGAGLYRRYVVNKTERAMRVRFCFNDQEITMLEPLRGAKSWLHYMVWVKDDKQENTQSTVTLKPQEVCSLTHTEKEFKGTLLISAQLVDELKQEEIKDKRRAFEIDHTQADSTFVITLVNEKIKIKQENVIAKVIIKS